MCGLEGVDKAKNQGLLSLLYFSTEVFKTAIDLWVSNRLRLPKNLELISDLFAAYLFACGCQHSLILSCSSKAILYFVPLQQCRNPFVCL